jgi:hypothetical protein
LQAEQARDEAAARQAEAEQQLAAIEAALKKARGLRALVGDEVISRGEVLLQETRAAAQAGVVTQIVQGRLRSGWSINRVNARLARQAAGERPAARRPQEAESVQSAEGRNEARAAAPVLQPAEPALQSSEATASGDLEGLSPQVAVRLQRVGLSTRAAVEEILAAGEEVFLALPGVGPATLAVVQAWLSAPAPTCVTETETDPQPEEPATAEIVHDGTAAAAHHTGSLAEG